MNTILLTDIQTLYEVYSSFLSLTSQLTVKILFSKIIQFSCYLLISLFVMSFILNTVSSFVIVCIPLEIYLPHKSWYVCTYVCMYIYVYYVIYYHVLKVRTLQRGVLKEMPFALYSFQSIPIISSFPTHPLHSQSHQFLVYFPILLFE